MANSKSTSTVGGSSTCPRSSSNSFEDRDSLFTTANPQQKSQDFSSRFGDLFSSARYTPKLDATTMTSSSNFKMFRDFGALAKSSFSSSTPPPPVYDKPVYNDDIFYGVPELKSLAANAKYEDVFTSVAASSPPKRSGSGIRSESDAFDDLLGRFGNVDYSYNLNPKELCTKISLYD